MEITDKRAVASAIDWPGWVRIARDEEAALAALAEHSRRYQAVAEEAGVSFAPGGYEVVERVRGTGATDFGVPDRPASLESTPLNAAAARRGAELVRASWVVLERVAARAPASLRKGPRGGGRDRDAIVEHVAGAEHEYARRTGIRMPAPRDAASRAALREAILDALRRARDGKPLTERGWTARYAARRIAWHALDHAWEIENRSES
jgi:hypothetical protein